MQKELLSLNPYFSPLLSFAVVFLFLSCNPERKKVQEKRYQTYCGSCHMTPKIEELPREIWKTTILPDMAARLGLRTNGYDPYNGLSYEEMEATIRSGIYPASPLISEEVWSDLESYILELAPDSLAEIDYPDFGEIEGFTAHTIGLDSLPGALITYLGFDNSKGQILSGTIDGRLLAYNALTKEVLSLANVTNPIVDYTQKGNKTFITEIGKLDPTQLPTGRLVKRGNQDQQILLDKLHRPVHTLVVDLNEDGQDEFVVSEFGDLRGQLSLFSRKEDSTYKKTTLLSQPGTIRVLAQDMNQDGKKDLIAQTSQGDESITVLYQSSELTFTPQKLLRFSPVYGSSWFELLDYDGDGDQDIITVNGDNADKSYVHKPYHGLRIHINQGDNQFEEKFFFPMNGATRVISGDYDRDGDLDFFVVATFPDYSEDPLPSLVYLENEEAQSFRFTPKIINGTPEGRWFLLTSGDIDADGDEDVVVSSFTYAFTPVPETLRAYWDQTTTDLLILENTFGEKEP